MKNEIIAKCVSLIDEAESGEIFLSKKTSSDDRFFHGTITHGGSTATLHFSGAHNMCSVSINNEKIELEYNEFKSLKDLFIKKLGTFSDN